MIAMEVIEKVVLKFLEEELQKENSEDVRDALLSLTSDVILELF